MPMNFPDTPTNGQSFVSGGVVWTWNGTVWNPATAPGGSGVSNVFIADAAPANPVNGNLWWNSAPGIGQLYIAYNDGSSTQFVAANNTGGGLYLPLSGGTLTGPLIATTATFSGAVTVSTAPSAGTDVTNKTYVDSKFVQMTQAAYNALGVKDPNVLYVIVG